MKAKRMEFIGMGENESFAEFIQRLAEYIDNLQDRVAKLEADKVVKSTEEN